MSYKKISMPGENYVKPEEYKKQSNKVQERFMNWWQPKILDRIIYIGKSEQLTESYEPVETYIEDINYIEEENKIEIAAQHWEVEFKEEFIPLFQVHQLIDFIQDITQSKFDMRFYFEDNKIVGYEFNFYKIYDDNVLSSEKHETIIIKEIDKFKAFWKLACKIAEKY